MGSVPPVNSQMQTCLTLPYKTVSELNLELDLYLPPLASEAPHNLRPTLIYFHGGGLTVGEKLSWFPSWLYNRAMAVGYIFISVEYRLLPPATGHDIIADITDLFLFIQRDVNDVINSHGCVNGVDTGRIAVAGTSAGGLCAYLAGIHAQPKPRALLSMYGMGADFFTPHYLIPKAVPFFRGRELLDPDSFSEYLYPNSAKVTPASSSPLVYHGKDHAIPGYPANPRMLLARLYLQLGTFIDYYAGEYEPSLSEKLRPCLANAEQQSATTWLSLVPPIHRPIFPQFHLSAFSPTFLVHGSADTAVPVHESRSLYNGLQSVGVPAILKVCDGMEHSFDYGPEAEARWGTVFDDAFQFIKDHLSATTESTKII